MNGRKITILIAYLLVCVLTVLLCYKLGRGKEQIAESRDEPRRRERARKSPNGLQRMTAAAEPDLSCTVDACCDGEDCAPDEHGSHHNLS